MSLILTERQDNGRVVKIDDVGAGEHFRYLAWVAGRACLERHRSGGGGGRAHTTGQAALKCGRLFAHVNVGPVPDSERSP